jgi:hypothetical protein
MPEGQAPSSVLGPELATCILALTISVVAEPRGFWHEWSFLLSACWLALILCKNSRLRPVIALCAAMVLLLVYGAGYVPLVFSLLQGAR